ncbi:sugar kinase [Alkalicoccus daliensis]|uniref:2-dehydro-3-deoxygluconokinase n=1 Tax=Alkalicoccus daliensis TaxID=745820 RepID=A0A1H0G7Y5_9BACI|nr:sugar kinase [Alkalicoccus daliensis]SDO02992.1 2-dehydro-3-deoxygluconokinase [Alkalicoccus daliensis]
MLDIITIGDGMITMNPKTRGPLRFSNEFERKAGGAELNLAVGAARLGLASGWISRVGNDEFGQYILNFMRGEGVDVTDVVKEDGYNTPLNFKEIREDGSGSTHYYRFPSPTETITAETLQNSKIKEAKIFYLSGVFPSLRPENVSLLHQAISIAKENGAKIALDPNIRLKLWSVESAREALLSFLPHVDIVLSGEEEAAQLFGDQTLEAHIQEFQSYGVETVAVKRGEKGAAGKTADEEVVYASSVKAAKVVDTVGAGDGFNAGFLYGILQDWPLEKTLQFANQVGSMVVAVSGDNEGLPLLEEVAEALGEKEKIER